MLRRHRTTIALLVVVALAGGAFAGLVLSGLLELPEPRGFSIDRVTVDATLRPDGVVEVREAATYTFTGADDQPFTVGSRTWDQGIDVISIAAYEDGEQRRSLLETPTLFEWDIAPATSGTRTYELVYSFRPPLRTGTDVAELYWQWVGSTSPAVGEWSGTITLPGGDGEVRAWAHGPLDGTLDVGGAEVTAEVPDVPAGSIVETRIAVPIERMDVAPGTEEILPGILAEEQRWADEANAARDAAAEAEDRRAAIERALNILAVPLAALAFWCFWMIWRRWGRDPERPTDIGDYWREVPDDPPAVAEAFLGWRQVTAGGYAATILDLARRGEMRIEEVPVERFLRSDAIEHRFIRTDPAPETTLRRFERRAVQWLFKDGPVITKSELVERNRKEQQSAARFWKGFKKEVLAELDRRDYVVRGKALPIALHLAIVAALVGLAVLAIANEAWIATAIFGVTAVLLLPLTFLHLQRTEAGARRHAEWTALRSYLHDFSRLDEAPVGHLVLWEEYLVAAVALGVAEELMRGLEVQHPELFDDTGAARFATWYVVAPGRSSSATDIGSFGSTFGSAAVSSFTPQSSGSGGGGGFSGGGGGGGGGGGFGAR